MTETRRVHSRWLEDALRGGRSLHKVRLILGARQTGKTVLLERLLPGGRSLVYNLQDTRLRRRFESDPAAFRQELEALPSHITHVAIDEVQKVPALLEEIQYLHDRAPRRFEFFLTGSSARKLRGRSANLLPGRAHVYDLYPVLRCEEVGHTSRLGKGSFAPGNPFPERSLEDRLRYGSLPGVMSEPPVTATATLESYVENYLEEEIRREGLVRNVGSFINFLRVAALESGRQMNLSRLSQESGVPSSTVRLFYQLLVDTFVGHWIAAYGPSGRKQVLTTERFLFFDLGVRNAATGLSFAGAWAPEIAGGLLEQWVGQELIHRAGYLGRTHAVTFWRTTTGLEVDYVWQSPDEHVPIEVKWTDKPRSVDASHVEKFLDTYPRMARRGLLVCRVPRAQQLTARTIAIPWTEL